jgi:CheY-like chemotaxis protein
MLKHAEERRKVRRWSVPQVADWTREALFASLSHEIRNPLNAVIGMIDRLEPQRPVAEQDLQALQCAASYLHQTVEQTFAFAMNGMEGLRSEQTVWCLEDLLDGVLGVYQAQASSKGLALTKRIEHGERRRVCLEGGLIQQILGNLVHNAIRYTEQGKVMVSAELLGDGCDAELLLIVEDTGVGIPLAEQQLIFEPAQAGATGRSKGGTGLGLAVIRCLVHALGGRMDLDSMPGKGSAFALRIPVRIFHPAAADAGLDGGMHRAIRRLRVLLVEDLEFNRHYLQRTLEDIGCTVDAAADAASAVVALEQKRFDWVLTDLDLPDRCGADWVGQLQRLVAPHHGATRIAAITGMAAPSVAADCLLAGATTVLTKPVSATQLRALLQEEALPVDIAGADILADFGLLADRSVYPDQKAACDQWLDGYLKERALVDRAVQDGSEPAICKALHRLLTLLHMLGNSMLKTLVCDLMDVAVTADQWRAGWQRYRKAEGLFLKRFVSLGYGSFPQVAEDETLPSTSPIPGLCASTVSNLDNSICAEDCAGVPAPTRRADSAAARSRRPNSHPRST